MKPYKVVLGIMSWVYCGCTTTPPNATANTEIKSDNFAPAGDRDNMKAFCGDGIVQPGELCDDANINEGDGCNACVLEVGWQCLGAPSTCQRSESKAAPPEILSIDVPDTPVQMLTPFTLSVNLKDESYATTKRWIVWRDGQAPTRSFYTKNIHLVLHEPGMYHVRIQVWNRDGRDERLLENAFRVAAPTGRTWFIGEGGDYATFDAFKGSQQLRYGDLVLFKAGATFNRILLGQEIIQTDGRYFFLGAWHFENSVPTQGLGNEARPIILSIDEPPLRNPLNASRLLIADLNLQGQDSWSLIRFHSETWFYNCEFNGGGGVRYFAFEQFGNNTTISDVVFEACTIHNFAYTEGGTFRIVLNNEGSKSRLRRFYFLRNEMYNYQGQRSLWLLVSKPDDVAIDSYFENIVIAESSFRDGNGGVWASGMGKGEQYFGLNRFERLIDDKRMVIALWLGGLHNGIVELNIVRKLRGGVDQIDNVGIYPIDRGPKTIIDGEQTFDGSQNVHIRWNDVSGVHDDDSYLMLQGVNGGHALSFAAYSFCCEFRSIRAYGNLSSKSSVAIAFGGVSRGDVVVSDHTDTGSRIGVHWGIRALNDDPTNSPSLISNTFLQNRFPVVVRRSGGGQITSAPRNTAGNRFVADEPACMDTVAPERVGFEQWPLGPGDQFILSAVPAFGQLAPVLECAPQ